MTWLGEYFPGSVDTPKVKIEFTTKEAKINVPQLVVGVVAYAVASSIVFALIDAYKVKETVAALEKVTERYKPQELKSGTKNGG
jgi:hypothetical protein